MGRYFAGVNFTIEAESEIDAEEVQQLILKLVSEQGAIVDASADERVEFDEYGHAG